MSAYRKKPEIGKTDSLPSASSWSDSPMGCILLPLAIVLSYFALSAIVRVTSNSGSELDHVICYGALILFVVIMLMGIRNAYLARKARETEKKRWAQDCKTALLTIVNRYEATSWWDDYSSRYHNAPNSIELEMNSDQKAVSPNQTVVNVEVDRYVYDRLEKCNTVRVYYMPESPLTFLLEDEL